jgi:hypothetical protein
LSVKPISAVLWPNVTLPGKCLVPPSGDKIKKKTAESRTGAL